MSKNFLCQKNFSYQTFFHFRLKMSWFKKIFGSQSSQSSQGSQTSQEPKVYFSQEKKEEKEKATTTEFKDCNNDESTYSWSGVSQAIGIKGEQRSWDDSDEEEPWWEAFKSQLFTQTPTQTSSQGASQQFELEFKNEEENNEENYNNDQTQTQILTQTQDDKQKISFY